MCANPMNILTRRFRFSSTLWFALTILYICFSFFLFFKWVDPSLDGRSDKHIAADSTTYIEIADSLRQGGADPLMIAAFFSFPNTLLCPTLIALILKSTFAMVVANYVMLFWALALLKRGFSFSVWGFLGLLALNATTTISLISVNKEIVDLLAVSIFIYAIRRRHISLLLLALLLASLNRFEVSLAMLVFLFVTSKLNPWRQKRALTLGALIIGISVTLPLLASESLNVHIEDASGGHAVVWLDYLEMHYLYGLAVIPKIAENLFAEIIDIQKFHAYLEFSDIANTYILFFNNLATAIVLGILVRKRAFVLKNDLIYFAAIGWIVMAIALVIQPRYFYFAYVLLCLQATQMRTGGPAGEMSLRPKGRRGPNASLLDHKETAFG
jgi:hypothetical protein